MTAEPDPPADFPTADPGPSSGHWSRHLWPPDLRERVPFRSTNRALRITLAFALAVVVLIPFFPGLSQSERVRLALLVATYGGFAGAVLITIAPVSARWAWLLSAVGGVVVTFACSVAVPKVLPAALFAYVVAVVASTCIGGLVAGLWISVLALVGGGTAEWLSPLSSDSERLTLLMCGVSLVALSLLVDVLTKERRRTATNLARLHRALREVTATPSLGATLDSIVETVNRAVNADATGVLLREDDHLVLAAPGMDVAGWPPERVEKYTRSELAMGDESPLAYAVTHGETVVVRDLGAAAEFPLWDEHWAAIVREYEARSMVAVPLHLGADVIGVFYVFFARTGALEKDELALLEAYAEQASLVIVRAQAYEHERKAAAQLQEADRLKSEFLALVSHELRTPLTATKGFVDTVLLHWDRLDDSQRRPLLERASSNADVLARLIGQLLQFARLDAGAVEVRPRAHDLHRLVNEVTSDLVPLTERHVVDVEVPDDLCVMVDEDAFGHVLSNLLTNAVKFSRSGSRVVIGAGARGPEVVVAVSDEGIGIDPREQDRIFERFYQSPSVTGSGRGTGIGLAIAHRFVEAHGGRIWVESTPGVGSTFRFTILASPTVPASAPIPADGVAGHTGWPDRAITPSRLRAEEIGRAG